METMFGQFPLQLHYFKSWAPGYFFLLFAYTVCMTNTKARKTSRAAQLGMKKYLLFVGEMWEMENGIFLYCTISSLP